jgi:CheY-like chemotaxis protein
MELTTDILQVLVVDDVEINRTIARALLAKLGHTVTAVASGYEALKLLEQQPFDLVLMDVQMPEMDGYETTQRIRQMEREKQLSPMAISALTAYAQNGEDEKCFAAGMDYYLTKPISRQMIITLIDQVILGRG